MKPRTSLTLASIAAIVAGCATEPPPVVAHRTAEPVRTTSAAVASPQRALEALSRVAVVEQGPQETVITLPISSLFMPGESTLLPEARDKLDRIASALSRQGPDVSFYVDARTLAGDTDISKKRAATVRSYLVERGVPGERIQSEGLAPDGENADVQILVQAAAR